MLPTRSREPFAASWTSGSPRAARWLALPTEERLRDAARDAGDRRASADVLSTLAPAHDAQRRARDRLAEPGATCVVTGQQAGLFAGPLYTVHKAASALRDAQAIEALTGRPCVAVFWVQSEDHDFEEIRSTTTLTREGALLDLTVDDDPADAGRPIRARRWGPSVLHALDALAEALGDLPHAEHALALLRAAYLPTDSPNASLRRWLDATFGPHGLLVLDPSDPSLDALAAPIHRRAILEADRFAEALTTRAQALADDGFHVQVHARADAPLSFVHRGDRDAPRTRFIRQDGAWVALDDHAPLADEAVQRGPHSTSALLRPILQDSWLPTVATVCGPGEISYFAQLPPLYEAWGLPMPAILPRARFRVVDDVGQRCLDQLGLPAESLHHPTEALLTQLGGAGEASPEALEAAWRDAVSALLAPMEAFAPRADAGFGKAVDKGRESLVGTGQRLIDRLRRERARADEVLVGRLERARARLAPRGLPQERVLGWPWFAARYGPGFVDAALAAVVPFDGALRELRP